MSFRIHDGVTQLSLSSQAATAEEAKAKATQLGFLLKMIGQNQKTKNPIVSELLSNIAVTANEDRINAVISISCARAADMLRMQSGGTTR
jgi:P2-related tail formation protein